MVDLKGQVGEINGFREGQPPTMHNLNPFSETVKSVRKKKEKQALWFFDSGSLRVFICFQGVGTGTDQFSFLAFVSNFKRLL